MRIQEIFAKVGEDRIRQAVESDEADALKNLLERENIKLTDEQLDYVAGGVGIPRRPKVPSPTTTQAATSTPTLQSTGDDWDYIDTDDPNSPNWTDDDSLSSGITETL